MWKNARYVDFHEICKKYHNVKNRVRNTIYLEKT